MNIIESMLIILTNNKLKTIVIALIIEIKILTLNINIYMSDVKI